MFQILFATYTKKRCFYHNLNDSSNILSLTAILLILFDSMIARYQQNKTIKSILAKKSYGSHIHISFHTNTTCNSCKHNYIKHSIIQFVCRIYFHLQIPGMVTFRIFSKDAVAKGDVTLYSGLRLKCFYKHYQHHQNLLQWSFSYRI